jgi:hypothetical protein
MILAFVLGFTPHGSACVIPVAEMGNNDQRMVGKCTTGTLSRTPHAATEFESSSRIRINQLDTQSESSVPPLNLPVLGIWPLKIVRISDYLEIQHMAHYRKACINTSRNNLKE